MFGAGRRLKLTHCVSGASGMGVGEISVRDYPNASETSTRQVLQDYSERRSVHARML
jgi:hypothetical protein